jgi:hypothetical protein
LRALREPEGLSWVELIHVSLCKMTFDDKWH